MPQSDVTPAVPTDAGAQMTDDVTDPDARYCPDDDPVPR